MNVQKLRGKMTEMMVTQADLAEATGLNRSTINRKLKTGEDFTVKEANIIADLLQLTADEAMIIFFNR